MSVNLLNIKRNCCVSLALTIEFLKFCTFCTYQIKIICFKLAKRKMFKFGNNIQIIFASEYFYFRYIQEILHTIIELKALEKKNGLISRDDFLQCKFCI